MDARKPVSDLVTEAMAYGVSPASVKKPAHGFGVFGIFDTVDTATVPHEALVHAGRRLQSANALRSQAQRQIMTAVWVMTDRQALNLRRLTMGDGSIRKPRVMLWGELTGAGTLQLFWAPLRVRSRPVNWSEEGEETDYVEERASWEQPGVRPNVAIRLQEGEYVARSACTREVQHGLIQDADDALRHALSESLLRLLATLSVHCHVQVGNWPEYDEGGRLVLVSGEYRARRYLFELRKPLEKQLAKLSDEVNHKLSRLGLPSSETFEAASARAAAEGSKLTTVLFKENGRRCTSLQTNSVRERLDRLRSSQSELDALEMAISSLATVPQRHWQQWVERRTGPGDEGSDVPRS